MPKGWLSISILFWLWNFLVPVHGQVIPRDAAIVSDQHESQYQLIEFTPEERRYLEANPVITVALADTNPPRAFLDGQGNLQGINVDILTLIEERLGVRIELVPSDWKSALESVRHREVDAIMNASKNKSRESFLDFTSVYIATPQAIIARGDEQKINDLSALCGRTVAVVASTSRERFLKDSFPCIKRVSVSSNPDIINAIITDQADAGFANYDQIVQNLRSMLVSNLNVIYSKYLPPIGFGRIGVRKDKPELTSILNKAVVSLRQIEINAITQKWVGVNFSPFELTVEEFNWIRENPIVNFTGDPNWLPYEAFDPDGQYIGIVADHLALIEETTGVTFNALPVKTWTESLQLAMGGEVSVISGDAADVILNKSFRPVDSYSRNPIVIVMDHQVSFINDLDEISDKRIAIIKDYGYTADIYRIYPDIDFIEVENIQEGLSGVSQGQLDAMLVTMALASYHMAEMGLHNLSIVGKTPIVMNLTLFVDKDLPLLHSLIEKALYAIEPPIKQGIYHKWIRSQYVEKVDYTITVIVAFSLLAIIGLIIYSNSNLQREVRRRLEFEKKLTDAQKSLTEAQRIAHMGSWVHDIKTGELHWSDEVYRIFELDTGTFSATYDAFLNAIHPQDRERVQLAYEDSLVNKTPYKITHRLLMKDGRIKYVDERCSTTYDDEGGPLISTGTVHDVTLQKEQEQKILLQAHYDDLTKLPNRILLTDRLNQAMLHSKRRNTQIAIGFLDLDGFKQVNDRYGHVVGDKLLDVLAQRMQTALRDEDTIARIGGDEFVILIPNLDEISSCTSLLNRLLHTTSQLIDLDDVTVQVSSSIGVTFFPQKEESIEAEQLIRQADQAMYQAKLSGKNCFHLFDTERDDQVRSDYENIQSVIKGIDNSEFNLHYQPKVNMHSGQVVGLEALLQWNNPQQGILSPKKFLPAVEKHPVMIQLGELVLEMALNQLIELRESGIELPISINISALQFEQENFVHDLADKIRSRGLDFEMLELEILESSALQDVKQTSLVISECRRLGIRIAIDDFGTGYSSLQYLKHLPTNQLKIDQGFVRDMHDDPEDLAILDGIIGLAKAFNREVLAEGVETVDHGILLLQFGCQLGQGYAIARPMPVGELSGWLESWICPAEWRAQQPLNQEFRQVLYAVTEHRAWVKELDAFVRSRLKYPPALDERECNFGKWLNLEAKKQFSNHPKLFSIDKIHREIHEFAAYLIDLCSKGRNETAIDNLKQLYILRDRLASGLMELIDTNPSQAGSDARDMADL
ncbi:MAG: EAL domain-containing protein [Candidatus Thiodiazotropha taylori]